MEEFDDGVAFLDEMDIVALKLRMVEAIDRIEEEHRVLVGIAHRMATYRGNTHGS